MSEVEVGISGWTYDGWRGTFYPEKLAHKDELKFASRELPTIEINGTFYSLQRPTSYQHWYELTPDHFKFAVKANRFITHIKRLKDIETPMANFFASGPLCLREKLGPFLWQFPPSMQFDPDRFETFLKLLPTDFEEAHVLAGKNELFEERTAFDIDVNYPIRHAVEIRNVSFLNPWFVELLREHQVAIVFADTAGKWPYMEDLTSDFVYVRLHGDEELYVSGYDDRALDFWSERIKLWKQGLEPQDRLTISEEKAPQIERDVYVYFDNDAKVRAPVDAKSLIRRLDDRYVA
ncbi:DUF72 domain-containing protein [Peredibacter starrii]|uniref:DUF72 domain-containing protein n=1 Tax=Peredibacter starrii TaxID=28202 RepID=A0AAX4HUY3_9BACT|nr:DUF72 domain-containing protein [Peredibacter starrii]WPU66998.1 DUF72 domain-containing protein [Peredibacter starrii]